MQPAERRNSHTHSGSDGARDGLTDETGDGAATVPGGGGEQSGEEEVEAREEKKEEKKEEEEEEEKCATGTPPLELQSEGKTLEEGPDQVVEGGNGRTSQVDQVETTKPVKSESPPLQLKDGEAEVCGVWHVTSHTTSTCTYVVVCTQVSDSS